jgi:hypothetical protein
MIGAVSIAPFQGSGRWKSRSGRCRAGTIVDKECAKSLEAKHRLTFGQRAISNRS